jgi:hypothetical protein
MVGVPSTRVVVTLRKVHGITGEAICRAIAIVESLTRPRHIDSTSSAVPLPSRPFIVFCRVRTERSRGGAFVNGYPQCFAFRSVFELKRSGVSVSTVILLSNHFADEGVVRCFRTM